MQKPNLVVRIMLYIAITVLLCTAEVNNKAKHLVMNHNYKQYNAYSNKRPLTRVIKTKFDFSLNQRSKLISQRDKFI